jgi:hypothetical protein
MLARPGCRARTASLPAFVREEFERYLDCGILCRGAGLLVCDKCPGTRVVALSCKGRGFCPSCLGRRMAQTSANLVDHVLPRNVPLRQWVLTFPFELRGRFGFDAKLLSAVCRVAVDALLSLYERRLRKRVAPFPAHAGQSTNERRRPKLQGGTVTVVQRTNSDFRLNPHLHVLALDGVFVEQPEGLPRFEQLPELTSTDVAEVVTVIRVRVLRLLARRGVIETPNELELLPTELTDREPALAQLTGTAARGLPPAGPERRQREPSRCTRRQLPSAMISQGEKRCAAMCCGRLLLKSGSRCSTAVWSVWGSSEPIRTAPWQSIWTPSHCFADSQPPCPGSALHGAYLLLRRVGFAASRTPSAGSLA